MDITLLKDGNYFKNSRKVTKHFVFLPPLTQLYFIRFLVYNNAWENSKYDFFTYNKVKPLQCLYIT